MAARVIGMLQNYAEFKENYSVSDGVVDNSLHSVSGSCGGKLERTTQGETGMDGMARRGNDNFIRWCHRCKHEVPENVMVDRCDLCGGEIIKIFNESEDKQ